MADNYFIVLQGFASQHLEMFFFYITALLAIPLAYGVLFDPRIIRSGFLLIGVFGTISALFLLLTAQFLAMAQLMIYAVGITLVVVIALMLTNPRLDPDAVSSMVEHKLPAFIVAVASFITIYFALRSEPWPVKPMPVGAITNNVTQIGANLLGYYSLPFEFASVLLFIALVGAIMLAKNDETSRAEEWVDDREESYGERTEDVVKV